MFFFWNSDELLKLKLIVLSKFIAVYLSLKLWSSECENRELTLLSLVTQWAIYIHVWKKFQMREVSSDSFLFKPWRDTKAICEYVHEIIKEERNCIINKNWIWTHRKDLTNNEHMNLFLILIAQITIWNILFFYLNLSTSTQQIAFRLLIKSSNWKARAHNFFIWFICSWS